MGIERDKDVRQLFLGQPVLNILLQRAWPLTSRKIAFPPRKKRHFLCMDVKVHSCTLTYYL